MITHIATAIDRTKGREPRKIRVRLEANSDPGCLLSAMIKFSDLEPIELIDVMADEIRPFAEFIGEASARFECKEVSFHLCVGGKISLQTIGTPTRDYRSVQYRCVLRTDRRLEEESFEQVFEFDPIDLQYLAEVLLELAATT
ncbi:hypothetical protein [Shimia sp. MIT1388]|uniref:hypothetical protein n=1 Tax=Shimia sp. MIT1388 TaxID=3096992 RepID=UPI00399B520B